MKEKLFVLYLLFFLFPFTLHSLVDDKWLDTEKWILSGGQGERERDPVDGKMCLTVSGNGDDSNNWRLPFPFKSNQLYRISCQVRTSPGTVGQHILMGSNIANRDVTAGEKWQEKEILFKTPARPITGAYLRLGQWHVKGTVWFRNIKVEPLQPVYAGHQGYSLGNGEYFKQNIYRAIFNYRDKNGNASRCLVDYDAYFNTHRWDLSGGDYVLYRHQLPAGRNAQIAAEVVVNIGYHDRGKCVVEASRDGKKWVTVGTIQERQQKSFDLPARLFPSPTIFIRLRARGALARLQIYGYEYRADLQKPVDDFIGQTDYVTILDQQKQVAVNILSLRAPSRNGEHNVVLSLRNNSTKNASYDVLLQEDGKTLRKTVALFAGQTRRVEIPSASGADHISATISVRPKGKSNIVFAARARAAVPYLRRSDYGHLIGESHNITFWWTDAVRKISRERPAPATPKDKTIRFFCAKNEYEPMQLVLRPLQDIENLSVQVTPLRHSVSGRALPANSVQVMQVDYLFVQYPSDASATAGYWPDPLPPIGKNIALKKGQNQPLWILVYIPEDAAAGDYRGSIRIRGRGWTYVVPMQVHVWDFALPRETHLQSAFGFQPSLVKLYHHFNDQDDLTPVLEKYFRNFAQHRLSPYNPFALNPIKETIDRQNLKVHLDFSDFDKAAKRYLDELRFNSFRLNVKGLGSGTFHSRRPGEFGGFKEGTPQYEKLMQSYLSQLQEHLQQNNWLDKAYIYWFDEPDEKDYDFVKQSMAFIHRAAPGLTRMLTEQPEPELYGYVDLWCPVTPEYNHRIAEQRRQKGERFWWYICTWPHEPYCTLFIDHNAVELRTWIWQTWKYNVDGILIWQSNYWTSPAAFPPPSRQNPYQDPMSYKSGYGLKPGSIAFWGNGDGRFIYPPKKVFRSNERCYDGPVSSIRWEMLREGMEDYEYFWLLRDLVEKASDREDLKALVQAARALLQVPEEVTVSLTEFSQQPEPMYSHRARMANMIEQLKAKL